MNTLQMKMVSYQLEIIYPHLLQFLQKFRRLWTRTLLKKLKEVVVAATETAVEMAVVLAVEEEMDIDIDKVKKK